MARMTAALFTLFSLAACSAIQQSQPIAAYRAGGGVVEGVQAVAPEVPGPVRTVEAGGGNRDPLSTYSQPALSSPALQTESAATGASGPAVQLNVRMDDGTRQNVLALSRDFKVGDRVHVTAEGRAARQ